jgi:putative transposase
MAGIDITVDEALLAARPAQRRRHGRGAIDAKHVDPQVWVAQADEATGTGRYERSEERVAYRSGTRHRTIYTRVGSLTRQVPLLRDDSFRQEIFKCYQSSEQAFVLTMLEMIVQGVSTRKVAAITQELCGTDTESGVKRQAVMPQRACAL